MKGMYKVIIGIFCLVISFGSMANTSKDSLQIKVDKNSKSIMPQKGLPIKGFSLKSDLQEVFKSKGMTLDDATWFSIREIVNADSPKDTVLNFNNNGQIVQIAFQNITKIDLEYDSDNETKASSNSDKSSSNPTSKPGRRGIHIKDGDDEVHITKDGIMIKDGGNEMVDIDFNDEDDSTSVKKAAEKAFEGMGSFNIQVGLNGYTGNFAPQNAADYELKTGGSRYFSFGWNKNAILINGNNAKLKLNIGLEFSWYNFMLANEQLLFTKGTNNVELTTSNKDLKKSKLTASYITLPLIPYLSFKKGSGIEYLGFGPYLGYRLGAHSKTKTDSGGKKDKESNSFYLENFRYGLTLQLGLNNLPDLFFNYDLNKLFQAEKGPKLNGFSFGIRI